MSRIAILLFLITITITGISQVSYTFEHNGVTRNYLLNIPDDMQPNSPLVFVLHGYGGNANSMTNLGWEQISDDYGVMVCYPNGTTDPFGSTHWNANLYADGTDDHDFLSALAHYLQETYGLSIECTYSCGFSNGGFMSLSLACQEPEKFKGIGSVGGLMSDFDFNNCTPNEAIPIIQLHGTNDQTVTYENGVGYPFWGYEGVEEVISFWQNELQTTETSIDLQIQNTSVDFIRHFNDIDQKEIHHYRVNGAGHEWFGSFGNMEINSTEEIWGFFSSYCNNPNTSTFNMTPQHSTRTLNKVVDALGREVDHTTNQILFQIYDDGSVEKKFIVE